MSTASERPCICGHTSAEHPHIGHWERIPCAVCNCCQYIRARTA